MAFISVTRLRVRSFRFLPLFVLYTFRSIRQVRQAPGFETGALLADRYWTFWTLTAWDTQESMRAYIVAGAHKAAMTHLMHWCDEASVAHWTQQGGMLPSVLPSWADADARMRATGRPSKVLHPSPQHASLHYRAPRTTASASIPRA